MIEQDGFGEEARSGGERRSGDRRLSPGLLGTGRRSPAGLPSVDSGSQSFPFTSPSSDPSAPPTHFDEDPTGTFGSNPIGEYLRKQRVLRGITVEELSSMTRIPLRSLLRLEGGQFDGETDGFVRGFVRTVATALGLDEEDTLSRMLQEPSLGVWDRHSPSRSAKQALAITAFVLISIVGFLILRAGWSVLVGVTSDSGRGEVVLWQDPVRALAEATGASLDPAAELDAGTRGRGRDRSER